MYNIYTIGQQIMLADISSRMSLMISARPISLIVKPSSQLSLDGFIFYFKQVKFEKRSLYIYYKERNQ